MFWEGVGLCKTARQICEDFYRFVVLSHQTIRCLGHRLGLMERLRNTITPLLGKLLPLLGSNYDGEVVAAAGAIGRVLQRAGHSWHDLTNCSAGLFARADAVRVDSRHQKCPERFWRQIGAPEISSSRHQRQERGKHMNIGPKMAFILRVYQMTESENAEDTIARWFAPGRGCSDPGGAQDQAQASPHAGSVGFHHR